MVADEERLIKDRLVRAEHVVLENFKSTIRILNRLADVENLAVQLLIGVKTIDPSITAKIYSINSYF